MLLIFLSIDYCYYMKNIPDSLSQVFQQINAAEQEFGRPTGSVKLLAVSKTKPVENIQAAIDAGQTEFAENYVQEAIGKITQINNPDLIWHFIGPIQSNKARAIAEHFNWVHSIDRIKIAKRLNDLRPPFLAPLNVCIQVNISREKTKSGINQEMLNELVEYCNKLPHLKLRGLMTLPAPYDNFKKQRQSFKQLRNLLVSLHSNLPDFDTLSMGTTHDMRAAIAEGATMVRIGTALFGPRD